MLWPVVCKTPVLTGHDRCWLEQFLAMALTESEFERKAERAESEDRLVYREAISLLGAEFASLAWQNSPEVYAIAEALALFALQTA